MVPNGWSSVKLGTLMDFKNGLNTDKSQYGSGPKFINVMDVINNSTVTEPLIKGRVSVTEKQLNDYRVELGDVLFNRTSETPTDIARAAVYMDETPVTFGGFVIRGKAISDDLIPSFSVYAFQGSSFRSQVIALGQGAVRANIGQKDLSKVTILLPSKPEQRKIAKILDTWDKAIATTERLIANSQQQKKALMQQLLTGKKRFGMADENIEYQKTRYGLIPADWDYPSIGQICAQISKKNTEQADYPVLSCSKHDGFVDSLKYFKKKVYSDDTSGYRVIPYGCFGFPSNHIEEGSIGLQELYDFGIVSPIYVVFQPDTKRVNRRYLQALLKTEHYRQIFAASTNASVDRRGSLRWKEFSAIDVPLPSLQEQNQIADILIAADKEIDGLKQQLAHIKQEKQALMQQLLTGKRRVMIKKEI